MQSLAEKTLRWNFEIKHMAGKKNFGPDMFSRYPRTGVLCDVCGFRISEADRSWSNEIEEGMVTAVQSGKWVKVRTVGMTDREYVGLLSQLGTWSGPLH